MNYLTLAQRAATECGLAGTMTTTAGQVGSFARIVNWVGDAWSDLQTMSDEWDWMRSSNILGAGISFVPAAAQANTPLGTGAGQVGVAVDSFGKWDIDTFRCYTTTTGTKDETFLDCIPFDTWRDAYMLGAMRTVQTRPVVFAVGPDQSINLGPPPNGNYTITGDYWLAPSTMSLDTDTPTGLPTRWHMLIVYNAAIKYGWYEAAEDVIQRMKGESDRMYRQLEAARLPAMGWGGALA